MTSFICNTNSNTLHKCDQDRDSDCLNQFVTYDGELSSAISAYDLMKIEKNKIKLNFECISQESSQILGLGRQSYFIQALYKEFQFQSDHQIFSILLTNENGKLTVGQDYPNYNEIGIPFSYSSSYFQVDLETVSDDNNNIVFQPDQPEDYEIIVDTGSTLINMDSETFQSFIKSFSKCQKDPRGCPQKYEIYGYQCYFYNRPHYGDISNFYETFPEFNFNFTNGYQYKLSAKDYLINFQDDYYCLPFEGFARNYENKFKKIILLGQPFMRNKEFYFDLQEYQIFIKDPKASQNYLHYTNLSDVVLNTYIFVELAFIIGICFFYRKYSAQIRAMFRSSRPNQGVNPYA
ncbi:unnamed protein product [Paramecium octaurelia]|uniref:Peptidase A1 domain-containing protein n=1 Tax=Paramecium octaurelia TaxID=43137 RepID=A0A8S1S3V9_PAROT|nr:unnamed protein product [Paramecium octaurelia]